jgi:hypothetical protein
MKPIQIVTTVAAVLMLLAAARAAETQPDQDAEQELKRQDVPAPVLDAVMKKYPRAKLKKFGKELDEGKPIFEVELTSEKERISIDLTPEGKILAEETELSPAALPAPVKAGLQASKYKGWKITRAEKVIHDEKADTLAYELQVQSKKEKFEVVLDREGKITKDEAKTGKKED